jgi:hypothetical protein
MNQQINEESYTYFSSVSHNEFPWSWSHSTFNLNQSINRCHNLYEIEGNNKTMQVCVTQYWFCKFLRIVRHTVQQNQLFAVIGKSTNG